AGKHVYVEKPLAENVAQCQAIVAEQQKSGKHVAVGFNRRFAPAYRKARELLRANGGAHNIYYRIADTYCYTWGKNYPPGQRVFHELCHVFDLLRWLTGSEVETLYTVEARPDDEIITLKFRSGPVATILSSGWSTLDWPKEYLEAIAARGGLTVDSFVELRTYGLPGVERCYRFRGHLHPRTEWTQRYLYEALGIEALRALHAMAPDQFALECGQYKADEATAEDKIYQEFLAHRLTGVGYSVDKGWLHAMNHFGECIVSGKTPETAGARDGLIGELLANAVVESRKTKAPVRIGEA
ncbi:MAG: Gfo/Idh/MocA family oxidoreductase, partial [Planctomycetota bacterium]|nr:Gfo/Idh/MocA family oxidoreductase [Planctomycetota bacterium]